MRSSIGLVSGVQGGNDQYTKILLHMDGANGGTTFTDSNVGGSVHTWTASSATTSTASPKLGTASWLSSGTSAYIESASSSDFALGANDFTIDGWWKGTTAFTSINMFGKGRAGVGSDYAGTASTAGVGLTLYKSGAANSFSKTGSILDGNWHHVAFIRFGNTVTIAVDGVLNAGASFTGSVDASSTVFQVGGLSNVTGFNWTGNIDEFRLSVGIARWTSNFTPPIQPYF